MNSLFLLEFLVFDATALAWAGYELWSVRKSKWEEDDADKADERSNETPRHPEG
jgi:hypothetical protein